MALKFVTHDLIENQNFRDCLIPKVSCLPSVSRKLDSVCLSGFGIASLYLSGMIYIRLQKDKCIPRVLRARD